MKLFVAAALLAVLFVTTTFAVAVPGDRCSGSTRPDWQQEAFCPTGGGDAGSGSE